LFCLVEGDPSLQEAGFLEGLYLASDNVRIHDLCLVVFLFVPVERR
jgi:hypothetical protein